MRIHPDANVPPADPADLNARIGAVARERFPLIVRERVSHRKSQAYFLRLAATHGALADALDEVLTEALFADKGFSAAIAAEIAAEGDGTPVGFG